MCVWSGASVRGGKEVGADEAAGADRGPKGGSAAHLALALGEEGHGIVALVVPELGVVGLGHRRLHPGIRECGGDGGPKEAGQLLTDAAASGGGQGRHAGRAGAAWVERGGAGACEVRQDRVGILG